MLNEERVKYMTKLAFYESKGGSEDLKISFHFKKTYIRFQTFLSAFWLTVAYASLMFLLQVSFLEDEMRRFSPMQKILVIVALIGLYVILLIMNILKAKHTHKKKHARAYHRVKMFQEELGALEEMYEKEERNEDII